MQALNMRSDAVAFDMETRLLNVVQRVVLPGQSQVMEISLEGVARIRNASMAEIEIILNPDARLVTLKPGEALPVEQSIATLIVVA
jgi:hypothetical protein